MNPTPLSINAEWPIDDVVVTGALKDGHWLHQPRLRLIYVADNLEAEARLLWPSASCSEPVGVDKPEFRSSPESET